MRRNPKLLLILPKRTEGESRELWDMKYMAKMLGVRKYSTPPLSLPILAALTPDEFEIEISENADIKEKSRLIRAAISRLADALAGC